MTREKTFYLVDYRGKHFTIQDVLFELDEPAFPMDTITKTKALEPKFVAIHKKRCQYYGIPPVITKDKDLLKIYD